MGKILTALTEDVIDVPGMASAMISADYVIREGEVPAVGFPANVFYSNYTVDWKADDAYTRTIDQTLHSAVRYIGSDPVLSELLKKPAWTEIDRMIWERNITQKLNDAMKDCAKNLTHYRNDWLDDGVSRPSSLNRLSNDIENGTHTIEYDCDTAAITQAVLLQRLDNHFLPERQSDLADGDYRARASYYVCYGRQAREPMTDEMFNRIKGLIDESANDEQLKANALKQLEKLQEDAGKNGKGYHAFTMSSATGAVFDPVRPRDNQNTPEIEVEMKYLWIMNPDPIGDFISGRTLYTELINTHGLPFCLVYDANDESWRSMDGHDPDHFHRGLQSSAYGFLKYCSEREEESLRFQHLKSTIRDIIKNMDSESEKLIAEKPAVDMTYELLKQLQTRGLDQDSLNLLKDMLKDPDVNYISSIAGSANLDRLFRYDLYSSASKADDPQQAEEVRAFIEETRSSLERSTNFFLVFPRGFELRRILENHPPNMPLSEKDYKTLLDDYNKKLDTAFAVIPETETSRGIHQKQAIEPLAPSGMGPHQ
ncbi:MAG: hypothetical protein GC137_06525 [Alphaproteobacteria bacterium]|nr:hypothetical protein [Alphaproteobacteria bacterium]